MLRDLYPDAWFTIIPDGTKQLKVPVMIDTPTQFGSLITTTPGFQTECIQIRQSNLAPSLWWGYGKKTNRLAYWIDSND